MKRPTDKQIAAMVRRLRESEREYRNLVIRWRLALKKKREKRQGITVSRLNK